MNVVIVKTELILRLYISFVVLNCLQYFKTDELTFYESNITNRMKEPSLIAICYFSLKPFIVNTPTFVCLPQTV